MSVLHMRKFAGGRETPQEMHQRVAWAGRLCAGCGGPPAIRIKVLVPLREMISRAPEVVAVIAARNRDNPGTVPTVPTTYGAMVKTSDLCFCRLCAPAAERAAAHGPSWAVIEIDRGPDPRDRVQVGYGS